jgi:probable dihydroxyacetone kinase regulator
MHSKGDEVMEDKKELTKDLLTTSFKELIMQIPFEKITIKMITDGAGVIRPTFYKHFQDKYEILEWILKKELADKIQILIDNDMEEDIFRLLCNCLEKDKELYKKLYAIEGPNSFDELMHHFIFNMLTSLKNKYPLKSSGELEIFPSEVMLRFYTFGLTGSLKHWIVHDSSYSAEQVCDAYNYIIHNSILELIDLPDSKS